MNWIGTATGFRSMMAAFPTGVTVVSARDQAGGPIGMTCSSLCSVALDPPTLLVCLRSAGPTAAAVLASGAFTVNLLDEGARDVAELFASGEPDRFTKVEWRAGPSGPHLIGAAHSVADCRLDRSLEVGDHSVLFGEVEGITVLREPRPLLYGQRRYASWDEVADPASARPSLS